VMGCPVNHLSGGAENIEKDPQSFKNEAYVFRHKWSYDIWTTTTKFLNGGVDFMILPRLLNQR